MTSPRFTGRFDFSDYEAFYLTVTSAVGVDESISVESAGDIVKDVIENQVTEEAIQEATRRTLK